MGGVWLSVIVCRVRKSVKSRTLRNRLYKRLFHILDETYLKQANLPDALNSLQCRASRVIGGEEVSFHIERLLLRRDDASLSTFYQMYFEFEAYVLASVFTVIQLVK